MKRGGESGECTSRVVFPDFRVNAALPAHTTTTVEFTPDKTGSFGFACGMNMVHGRLVVNPGPDTASPTADTLTRGGPSS